jgi:hypothetical protein
MAEIDEEEWAKTPPTVKRAVVRLAKELEEINRTYAKNSQKPCLIRNEEKLVLIIFRERFSDDKLKD